jgi:hypothetical protein
MTKRNLVVFKNGVKTESVFDIEWPEVLQIRKDALKHSDQFMITDRHSLLTEAQQSEIIAYRQAWRDITETEDPNEAYDSSPDEPSWM